MKFIVKDKKTGEDVSVYGPLSTIRCVPCEVYLDDKLVYEGNTDDLPDDMKDYKYFKTDQYGSVTKYYVNSEYNI